VRASRVSLALLACAGLAAAASGCGGGAGSNGVAELTKRLSPQALTYDVADFTTLREDLGLDEEADPLDSENDVLAAAASRSLAVLAVPEIDPAVISALELGSARSAATSSGPGGLVTMIATDADTGEIGSALGDLGYSDAGGVLVKRGGLSFRLDVGIVFVSDPAALRALPEEAADDLPDPLLNELDGPFVEVSKQSAESGPCVRSAGVTSEADGTGSYAFRVNGDADAAAVRDGGDGVDFDEPEADGEIASVEADAGGHPAALIVSGLGSVGYEC
jgi:hypothetical protein